MAYKHPNYTPDELALRFLDIKACESLLGRHTYLYLQCKTREELSTLWCSEDKTPTLGYNYGTYVGYDEIYRCYVEAFESHIKAGDKRMQENFSDIRDAAPEDIYGVGTMYVDTFTTPVIELAGDCQTAKGLWYAPGIVTEIGETRPEARWEWKKVGVDFIKEDGQWKIWHMQFCTDFYITAGTSWAAGSDERTPLLPPTKQETLYQTYSSRQVPQDFPRIPEPYDTFANTFCY